MKLKKTELKIKVNIYIYKEAEAEIRQIVEKINAKYDLKYASQNVIEEDSKN